MSALRTLEAMEAELQQETYVWLLDVPTDSEGMDVRLQVHEDGSHYFHSGQACYDTDHRGYWGAATIYHNEDEVSLISTARDLVEQVLDSCAEGEG